MQAPKTREPRKRRPWWLIAVVATASFLAATALALSQRDRGQGTSPSNRAVAGLPNTSDYHSLLVASADASALLLGTHQGLYRSRDGGRRWSFQGLSGQDAMNLARPSNKVLWAAGHQVLAKSGDAGQTWQPVRPKGLPGLDVHGFAVDPRNGKIVYAAIANQGLFRSRDGGRSFAALSHDVGGAVMALAITPGGRILAGDMERGLLVSRDGRDWTRVLNAQVMGLAVNPARPGLVLASGPGIVRSTDGGRTWNQVLELAEGAGPTAWAPSDPRTAYAVGFDRTLYRTSDSGATWQAVR